MAAALNFAAKPPPSAGFFCAGGGADADADASEPARDDERDEPAEADIVVVAFSRK